MPAPRRSPRRRAGAGPRLLRGALLLLALAATPAAGPAQPEAPADLRETGLYADFEAGVIDPAHIAFAPQYPLWTDGARKRRWMALPPGTAIDAADPDAWVFPPGTRFWKEFAFDGRPVETRLIERLADGSWRYAAYAWSPDGSAAPRVSPRGQRGAHPLPGGRSHTIPGVSDCRVCHEARPVPILGFSALQLSPDRDPGALHAEPAADALDLADLVGRGLLAHYPASLPPPRIAAGSPVERAALGYLHGNCGHCHDAASKLANLGLFLRHDGAAAVAPARTTTLGAPVARPAPGASPEARLRIAPGDPDRSALAERIGARSPALQMPPLGTELVDRAALALIRRWIAGMDPPETDVPNPDQKEH